MIRMVRFLPSLYLLASVCFTTAKSISPEQHLFQLSTVPPHEVGDESTELLPSDDVNIHSEDLQVITTAAQKHADNLGLRPWKASIGSKLVEFFNPFSSSSLNEEDTTLRTTGAQKRMSLHRSLPEGDFDAFQELFQHAVIRLPDFEASDHIESSLNLGLTVTNILCHGILLGDMLINYNRQNNQRLTYGVNVEDLHVTCDMDFEWSLGILSGGGHASVRTEDSSAATVIAFTSQDFDLYPPHSSDTELCNADIHVVDLQFTGTVTAAILSIFESTITNRVQEEVSDMTCDELGSLVTTLMGNMLELAEEILDQYSTPVEPWRLDPVYPEKFIEYEPNQQIIDFNNAAGIGKLFVDMIQKSNSVFARPFESNTSPNGQDLGINKFLRNHLDSNRSFAINLHDIPTIDPVLFEGHDKLTETRLTLQSIKIFGLDTVTRFEPIREAGDHTYQVDLQWEFLTFEADIIVHIKPSTLEDSLLDNPRPISIIENIKVDFGLDNIDASVAMLLAIDQKALEQIEIGSLLFAEKFVHCILSAVRAIGVSGLNVSVGNIREPTLSGFVSRGIDRVVTSSVHAAFLMYENVIIHSIPSIFETTVRDLITSSLVDFSFEADCNLFDIVDKFVDFRTLFLRVADSVALGGFGDERYGDSVATMMGYIQNKLIETNNDGLLEINSMIVDPLTEWQSGVQGMVRFPSKLLNMSFNDFLGGLELSLSDARIRNLNTITAPLDFLQPTEQPHSLLNRINLGPVVGRSLNATIKMMLNLVREDSPLTMLNEIDISVTADSLELFGNILAMISTPNFMHFPLKDIANMHCWLAMFSLPDIDENMTVSFDAREHGLSLQSFSAKFAAMKASLQCHSCIGNNYEEGGLNLVLHDLVEILNDTHMAASLDGRFGALLQELTLSDSTQNTLDRLLTKASKLCPHSPHYEETSYSVDSFRQMLLPLSLSTEALDTILFGGVIALQLGFVLLVESNRVWSNEPSRMLFGQDHIAVSQGFNLLDWTNIKGDVSPLVAFAFEETKEYLNSFDDNLRKNLGDIFISQFTDGLLVTNGLLEMPIQNFEYESAGLVFKINYTRITGLQTLESFNVLDAVSPQTLQNTFHLKNMSIEFDISIDSTATADEPPQHVILSLQADDINITLPVFIGIDLDLLDTLELGALLGSEDVLSCILSAVHEVHITDIIISFGNLHEPVIEGLMPATASAASSLTRAVIQRFGSDVIETGFSSLLANIARPLLNEKLSSVVANSTCTNLLVPSSTDAGNQNSSNDNTANSSTAIKNSARYIDFRDLLLSEANALASGGSGESPYGDVFRWLYGLLHRLITEVDSNTSLSAVNDVIIGPLTRSKSGKNGMMYFSGDLFNHEFHIEMGKFDAKVRLRLFNATIENMDYIGVPLSVLDPIDGEAHQLYSTATAGVTGVPIRFNARFLVEILQDDGIQLRNDIAVAADFYALTVALSMLVKISEDKFARFPIGDLFNFHCWLATIPPQFLSARGIQPKGADPSAAVTHLIASLERMNLNLTCISCTSPGMKDLTNLLSNPEGAEDLTAVSNQILDYAISVSKSEYIQVQIDRLLSDAPRHCPHSAQYGLIPTPMTFETFEREIPDISLSSIVLLVALAASALSIVITVVGFVKWVVRRRHQRWLMSLQGQRLFALLRQQKQDDQKELELNVMTKSMFQSSAIPVFVRYLIPVVILGNVGFFLSGHLSLGAAVNIEGQIAGEHFQVEKLFDFSVAQSTLDIWRAGGKELAVLILIFSGIWPYGKQFVTLFLWFLPPRILSISSRGKTLLWLDALAKWSMVDVFTLLVSIASFSVSVLSPEKNFLPDQLYSAHLMVVPMWGLYANLIAQLISQISSHFIIYYHRRIVSLATTRYEQRRIVRTASSLDSHTFDDGNTVTSENSDGMVLFISPTNHSNSTATTEQKEKLSSHVFKRPHRAESDGLLIRPFVNYLFCLTSLLLSVLLVAGCILPTFTLEVLGVVGVAIETGQGFDEAVVEHSVFSIANLIADQAGLMGTPAHYFGLGTLSALCVLCVLIVPLMQMVALLVQWFYPMERKTRSRMCVLTEILQAWQYADVYVVAVIIASWQVGPVLEFMIGTYCNSLNDALSELEYFGILKEKDAQCFQMQASIEIATYLILAGTALLYLLNTIVTKAAQQYFRDKDASNNITTNHKLLALEDETLRTNNEALDGIRPAPILFTDTFRWFLHSENNAGALGRFIHHENTLAAAPRGLANEKPSSIILGEERPRMFSENDREQASNGAYDSVQLDLIPKTDVAEKFPNGDDLKKKATQDSGIKSPPNYATEFESGKPPDTSISL